MERSSMDLWTETEPFTTQMEPGRGVTLEQSYGFLLEKPFSTLMKPDPEFVSV